MHLSLVASLVLGLMCALGSARAEPAYFEKTFGGDRNDRAKAVVALPDGGFAIAADTGSKGAGEMDIWVLRLDREGRLLWDKTFGGVGWDEANDIVALPDGGFALVGSTDSRGSGGADAWVLRLDSSGGLLWDKTFGGSKDDQALSIVALPDGRLTVAGLTDSKGGGNSDAWVLGLDSTGQLVWDKTFGGADVDAANDIALLPDGGYALAAHTFSKGAGGKEAWLLRLDGQGQLIWDKTFGGKADEGMSCIIALPQGELVGGETASKGAGKSDAWLLKVSGQGELVWDKTYGGAHDDRVAAMDSLADAGMALAGSTNSQGPDNIDAWFLRLNGQGDVVVERRQGGKLADVPFAVAVGADGVVLAVGLTQLQAQNAEAWVITPSLEICTRYLPEIGRTAQVPCAEPSPP